MANIDTVPLGIGRAKQGKEARTMTKIAIVLFGSGGELDRRQIEVRPDQDESAVIGNAVISCIEDWTLSPGDTISIRAMEG